MINPMDLVVSSEIFTIKDSLKLESLASTSEVENFSTPNTSNVEEISDLSATRMEKQLTDSDAHDSKVINDSQDANTENYKNENYNLQNAIASNLKNDVYLADSDPTANLQLYHFAFCDSQSDDQTKQSRGVIKSCNEKVCQTFGFSEEIVMDDNTLKNLNQKSLGQIDTKDSIDLIVCHEGTLIKLFAHNDKWFLSTNKKLNALQSHWANAKSFGDQFIETLEAMSNISFDTFTFGLNQKYCYCFVLTAVDKNRIVCFKPENSSRIYLTGVFDKNGSKIEYDQVAVPKTVPTSSVLSFHGFNEIKKWLDNHANEYAGLITHNGDKKYISPIYQEQFLLRNNVSSLEQRYLELRPHTRISQNRVKIDVKKRNKIKNSPSQNAVTNKSTQSNTPQNRSEKSNEQNSAQNLLKISNERNTTQNILKKSNESKDLQNVVERSNKQIYHQNVTDNTNDSDKQKILLENRQFLDFKVLYKSYIKMFEDLESNLEQTITGLFRMYKHRYIYKNVMMVHPVLNSFLKKLHYWHCEDRENNKISRKIVEQTLTTQKPRYILTIINLMQ